jgi:hypothetical protein
MQISVQCQKGLAGDIVRYIGEISERNVRKCPNNNAHIARTAVMVNLRGKSIVDY